MSLFVRVKPAPGRGYCVLEFRAVRPAARSPKVPPYVCTEPRSLCDLTRTQVKHQSARRALIGYRQNETDLDATIPLVSVGNLMGAADGAALTAQQLLMQTNVIVHCIGSPQQ